MLCNIPIFHLIFINRYILEHYIDIDYEQSYMKSVKIKQALNIGQYLLTLYYNSTLQCWQNLGFFLNYHILDLLVVKQYKIH